MNMVLERLDSGLLVPRGRGKIELFSDRGKLKERVEFENFVAQDTITYQKYMARKLFWTGMAGTTAPSEGSSTTQTGAGSGANSNEGPARPEYWRPGGVTADWAPSLWPMQYIFTSTDAQAEAAATERLVRGSIVGWASAVAYTGTDTKRGTPNQSQCLASGLLTRWVFDWPTTAANGLFRSVGWGRIDATWGNSARNVQAFHGDAGTNTVGAGTIRQNIQRIAWDIANDRMLVYGHTANGTAGMWQVPKGGGVGTATLLFSAPSGAYAPGNVSSAIAYDGTGTPGIWLTHSTGSWLRKYDMTGALLVSATRTSSPLDGGAQARSLAFDGTDLWAVANAVDKVYRISTTTGEVLSSFTTGSANNVKTVNWFPSIGLVGVVGFDNILRLYSTAGVLQATMSPAMAYNQASSWQSDDTCGRDENGWSPELVNSQSYTNSSRDSYGMRYNRYQFNSLGARSLLPADLTKSSSQTMKITYQFDFV